eukprot:TRINITY_DN674_c0_g1_i5.p1 TRINITY_DN674_c0_g1~~TRINITY_DN674_c0_g1_i5.p1  ORF type:complete len:263 (-),score=21.54 TRINITY_DN674_c0_g1_i5:60-848(-)
MLRKKKIQKQEQNSTNAFFDQTIFIIINTPANRELKIQLIEAHLKLRSKQTFGRFAGGKHIIYFEINFLLFTKTLTHFALRNVQPPIYFAWQSVKHLDQGGGLKFQREKGDMRKSRRQRQILAFIFAFPLLRRFALLIRFDISQNKTKSLLFRRGCGDPSDLELVQVDNPWALKYEKKIVTFIISEASILQRRYLFVTLLQQDIILKGFALQHCLKEKAVMLSIAKLIIPCFHRLPPPPPPRGGFSCLFGLLRNQIFEQIPG